MKQFLVRTTDGHEYAVYAYTRRHAVAETLLAMIRDGKIKLLDCDASVVTRWSVEPVNERA